MKINVLCSDSQHPVFKVLEAWVGRKQEQGLDCNLVSDANLLSGGEFLFLISCSQIIPNVIIQKYKYVLVLHASDLPQGRGWSPHIWDIVTGKNEVTLSLLEASERVDTGDIWAKTIINFKGHELLPEINRYLFEAELRLMDFAICNYSSVSKIKQNQVIEKTWPKRTPEDSRLNPDKSIREQFNLLRVVDNKRYPAFFDLFGFRYKLTIEKMEQ